MEIYRECGYLDRDAALNIVQYNLHGLDIDKRAYQLAYFAVMMKARSYNRRALTSGVRNIVAAIEESNDLDAFKYDGLTNDKEQNQIGEYLLDAYRHAKCTTDKIYGVIEVYKLGYYTCFRCIYYNTCWCFSFKKTLLLFRVLILPRILPFHSCIL